MSFCEFFSNVNIVGRAGIRTHNPRRYRLSYRCSAIFEEALSSNISVKSFLYKNSTFRKEQYFQKRTVPSEKNRRLWKDCFETPETKFNYHVTPGHKQEYFVILEGGVTNGFWVVGKGSLVSIRVLDLQRRIRIAFCNSNSFSYLFMIQLKSHLLGQEFRKSYSKHPIN